MDLNRATLIGNVTQDPRVSQTPSGQLVASFSIATNRQWTDANGVKQNEATFHNIVAWRKLAEIVEKYLKKGRKIYIEGEIRNRDWVAKDGTSKRVTEIVASNLILLDRQTGTGENTSFSEIAPRNNSVSSSNDEISIDEINLDDIPV